MTSKKHHIPSRELESSPKLGWILVLNVIPSADDLGGSRQFGCR